MRRLIATAVTALVMWPASVGAVETDRSSRDGEIVVRDSRPGDATRARPAPHQETEWFSYLVVRWVAGNGFCFETMWTRSEAFARRQSHNGRMAEANGGSVVECPPDAVTIAPDPAAIAAASWQDVKNLPVPSLDIDPGHALAGKDVYLEISGAETWTETIDNPIGDDIVITATSDYLVDWGDPRRPQPTVTRSQGGPWPRGDVTHAYSDAAPKRTITVTQRWRATWSAGTQSGTLDSLSTTSAPLDLEVRQLQAVRNR